MDSSHNKITYIDQTRLHRAVTAGIRNVISRQDHLNKINVFPVPDGDTGTNLTLTLSAIFYGTHTRKYNSIQTYLEEVADCAINGARGNSGSIFAQFFTGLSEGSKYVKNKFTTKNFVAAVTTATNYTHRSLSEPKEGTILTVIRDFCDELTHQQSIQESRDFVSLLDLGLKRSRSSLTNTTNQLKVLKKAGVVDAGAQGFVDFLQGIYTFILDGTITELSQPLPDAESTNIKPNEDFFSDKYRYCTECIISSENIDLNKLRHFLETQGDCVIVAGSSRKAKIHLHTNNPQNTFETCRQYGQVSKQKADDMLQQQHSIQLNQDTVILTDSTADFNDNIAVDLNIHVVPLTITIDNKTFLDKVSITPADFYKLLPNTKTLPQTSQPSSGSFIRKYQYLTSHFKSVIAIHIARQKSGTIGASESAAKQISKNITVIDGTEVGAGLGMIVKIAAQAAAANIEHHKIISLIEKAKQVTATYSVPSTLEYAVKGGRLPKQLKMLFDFFNFKPILTFNTNGKIKPAGIVRAKNNLPDKLLKFLNKKISKNKTYHVCIAHTNVPSMAKKLKLLMSRLENIASIDITMCSPVLGCHVGPGALGIAIQEHINIEDFR